MLLSTTAFSQNNFMDSIFLIFSFILGAIIGSFLNVVVYRYKTGMTLGGRSKCFSCNRTLTWVELFPIASFVIQLGACKKCKSKISWQYPLVEAVTGILFILVVYFFPPLSITTAIETVFYLFITALLVVITVYDVKHKIIPDPLSYTFSAVALIHVFLAPSLWHFLAGPLLALPFFFLWLFSKGKWMGLGDAKIILGIGWVLGLTAGISAIILAFWIGAIISVVWMKMTFKKFKARYEIPFGPYLILGMYLVLFFHIYVIDPHSIAFLFNQ
jgi:prepilin signal peptidase PulO-like enzyme (type II secretory pathway)